MQMCLRPPQKEEFISLRKLGGEREVCEDRQGSGWRSHLDRWLRRAALPGTLAEKPRDSKGGGKETACVGESVAFIPGQATLVV